MQLIMMLVSQFNLREMPHIMVTTKNNILFSIICICLILFVGCNHDEEREDPIFIYDEKMQVFFEDASSGELKTTEIYLSEDQKRSLVEYLSSYRKMLTNDILKKEFLTWYRVILNDNTTL